MNYSPSPILHRALNCFYISLDKDYDLVAANEAGKKILNIAAFQPDVHFLSLFPLQKRIEWRSTFEKLVYDKESCTSLTTSFNGEAEEQQVTWNVCGLFNNENEIVGFEMVGVALRKPVSEKSKEGTTASLKLKTLLFKLKKVLNSSQDVICVIDEKGRFRKVSAASKELLGYEPRELIGRNFTDLVFEEDVERTIEVEGKVKSGVGTTNFENRYYKKDGSIAHLVWSLKWDDSDKRFYSIARNGVEKKAGEAALKSFEENYKILFYNHPLPTWIYDAETQVFIEVNEAAVRHYGYSRQEFLNMRLDDVLLGKEVDDLENVQSVKGLSHQKHKGLWIQRKKNGDTIYAEITTNYIDYQGRKAILVLSVDRTQQTIAARELIESNEKFISLSEATFDAIWDWNIQTGDVQWNNGIRKMFEMPELSTNTRINWWLDNLHTEDRERVEVKLNLYTENKMSTWEDEFRFGVEEKNYKNIYARGYITFDNGGRPLRMIGAMQDQTERKAHENMLEKLNRSLEKRAKELAESNAELERFAYVASHDLQEPLRMVTSFLQLLEKRYKDKLDQKAHEYITYAVDGAERMKRLILDLLEYSRVNSSKLEKEDVDIEDIIEELKVTYKSQLNETGACINTERLPVVRGNKMQLLQLFQNLIGNALKYRSADPPIVSIYCEEDDLQYKISVKDNGIGIDPKFFNKIFIIFQRLHNREQYSGTGIGLAICKKIIDKHGGRIWVTSAGDVGSTFHFTLPKSK